MFEIFLHREFVESWQKLSEDERDSVWRLLALLQGGNLTSGMRLHKIGSFWSLSPNMDLRIIAVKQSDRTTLIHIGHHDAAYQWAKQRSLLIADVVTTELICVSDLISSRQIVTSDGFSLPISIQDVLNIDDDDKFLHAISDMSPEWQEWVLATYTNANKNKPPPTLSSLIFCPVNDEELTRALKLTLPAWHLFLHPVQRDATDDLTSSSIAITGGPGTGKTVVLLNRVIGHAPKGKDEDCSLLLTYSSHLAEYLYDKLNAVTDRHFRVLPLYFLGGKLPRSVPQDSAFKKFRCEIENGRLYLCYRDEWRTPVRELLIDELQDAPVEVTRVLEYLIANGATRVVVAADKDQCLYHSNQKSTDNIIEACDRRYELTYCYRSSRQIIRTAAKWLSSYQLESSNASVFALSGPQVRVIECEDLAQLVDVSESMMRDLWGRYGIDDVALVYCQYFNPSFKGPSKEEEALTRRPEMKRAYRFASMTKGHEYFAGVVVISNSFLAKDLGEEANRLRINTLYVALTRFRDEVTIVYPTGCAIELQLAGLGQS